MSTDTTATAQVSSGIPQRTPEEIERIWGLKAAPTAAKSQESELIDAVQTARAFKARRGKVEIAMHGTPLDYAVSLIERPMDPRWKQGIRDYSPKREGVAYLDLHWKQPPGQPDKLRLVVYEMVPVQDIPSGMRLLLSGTPWWELPKEERAGRERMVSPFQWEMYRREQVWARPLWCIQGDHGGTPIAYTELEQDLLRLKGQPTDPPHLGALSFAPWDGRVERALAKRDRLWKFAGNIERMKRDNADPAKVQAEYDAAKKAFRAEFFQWWGEQLEEATEFLSWYETKCEADHTLRRATKGEMIAAGKLEEYFIEHGIVPPVLPE